MNHIRVNGLRGVELAVFDLKQTADFYCNSWGLEEVATDGGAMYLRGTGAEHHVLTVHERPRAGLVAINFSADDRRAVDGLHARAVGMGVEVIAAPHVLPAIAGGGYGFSLRSPEGQALNISCDVEGHAVTVTDRSRPDKLSHVVLNVEDIERQERFFCDVLGFRLTDSTARMNFIRCSSYHHSIALARAQGAGLNHIFSYFIEPNGFVTEYTTEVDTVDESTHVVGTPDYWAGLMNGPDRWGLAEPSKALREAMSGKFTEERNLLCEDVISRKLAG
jgi:catechol 2,3-dioxygenase-like lactoylglutathione lyase family enzyme